MRMKNKGTKREIKQFRSMLHTQGDSVQNHDIVTSTGARFTIQFQWLIQMGANKNGSYV